ncbi:MAG: aminodeoxychorismate synthase component I [Flavobacteriaceae bacterium]|jgi:para-aminobenzoate synthetase component 1|nr:aminodeoxychorismate synthase component I [Flavobacteriaceae bacterium]
MKFKDTIISQMNQWGKERVPFLFIIDFEGSNPVVIPLEKVNPDKILFKFRNCTNINTDVLKEKKCKYKIKPIDFNQYKNQFTQVQKEISLGNTYLLNLTVETPIEINKSLKDIFFLSHAPYKLWLSNRFVCFSPEIFIKIEDTKIYSYPMKGTIDGSLENAKEILLSDEKEKAEHYTIVDLIRNDLNSVAKNIQVDKFRYIDTIKTSEGILLQASSQISGDLSQNWNEYIGNILSTLLPAGSISGAPKERTVEIIKKVENHTRDYYTGVMGIFNGYSLDSAVMIRFIEEKGEKYFYKSGGGITYSSDVKKEYNELIQKIYVPVI